MSELPEVLQAIAEVTGEEAARRIGERMAGQVVKFPALATLTRPSRDESIRRAHREGASVAALAARFGLSSRRVRQILRG